VTEGIVPIIATTVDPETGVNAASIADITVAAKSIGTEIVPLIVTTDSHL